MKKIILSSIVALSLIPSVTFAEDANNWEFHPVPTLVGGLVGAVIAGPIGLILGAAGGEFWAHEKHTTRVIEVCNNITSKGDDGNTYIIRKCR